MRFIYALIFWVVIAIIAYFVVAFTGAYQVGADVPHWGLTEQAIGFVRKQTIKRRVADIKVPQLDDAAMVKEGAQRYSRMCSGCHVAPGKSPSPVHEDMYPRPPNLTRFSPPPAVSFWAIKHGLKMTGMPAWGKTINDQEIWAIVAYLGKQPNMSAAEYQRLTTPEPAVERTPPAAAGTAIMPPAAGSSGAAPASASSTR